MKKMTLTLFLMMNLSFLAQAGAAMINLDNENNYSSGSYTTWLRQIIKRNPILVLSGTNGEVSLLEVEMGNYTPRDPRDTVVMNQHDRIKDSIGWWRNNHDIPAPVPEPATMLFLGTGLLGIAGFMRVLGRR